MPWPGRQGNALSFSLCSIEFAVLIGGPNYSEYFPHMSADGILMAVVVTSA
jgi:hypothetical protein